MEQQQDEHWDTVISPKSNIFDLQLREVWEYKYLISMFIKRDFVAVYKQTILGPLWFLVQPIITTLTYFIIFNNIAQLSTDGMPPILFYLSGILIWNLFSTSLTKISETFSANTGIFGKVYFPRLTVPIATVISALIPFLIQWTLFLGVYVYEYFINGYSPEIKLISLLLIPYLILLAALLALSWGMIITSLTTKYRDLKYLITFGIQLFMYATPVVYPMSELKSPQLNFLVSLNPLTGIIENFRFVLMGAGDFNLNLLIYSSIVTMISVFVSIVIFNRVERDFIDTI